jgi:hypothetical protein
MGPAAYVAALAVQNHNRRESLGSHPYVGDSRMRVWKHYAEGKGVYLQRTTQKR